MVLAPKSEALTTPAVDEVVEVAEAEAAVAAVEAVAAVSPAPSLVAQLVDDLACCEDSHVAFEAVIQSYSGIEGFSPEIIEVAIDLQDSYPLRHKFQSWLHPKPNQKSSPVNLLTDNGLLPTLPHIYAMLDHMMGEKQTGRELDWANYKSPEAFAAATQPQPPPNA